MKNGEAENQFRVGVLKNIQIMEKQMSVGDWILTYLLMCIPLVGVIMLFVWAFSSGNQPSKKNMGASYINLDCSNVSFMVCCTWICNGCNDVKFLHAEKVDSMSDLLYKFMS